MAQKKTRPFAWELSDPESDKQLAALFEALNSEEPMACAILCAAYIERCLVVLLQQFFIAGSETGKKLVSHGGAVGELSGRARLAYCLGLIDDRLRHDIEKIGDIRNEFAHCPV